jgi:hypothetical protein
MSEYPLLPLFAAADAIHDNNKKPPVDWPAVDVITDRNGLRKLLRWLNPSEGREVRDFRIDVELVGAKTIVLNRWEGRTREPPISGRAMGLPLRPQRRALRRDVRARAIIGPSHTCVTIGMFCDIDVLTTFFGENRICLI